MDYIYLIVGLVFLALGAELLVKSIIAVSNFFKISKIFISTFVIGFCSTLPEVVTSFQAILKNSNTIAVGNVIGSNIFLLFFILPISALISDIKITNFGITKNLFFLIFSTILVYILSINNINFYNALFMLLILIIYSIYSAINSGKDLEKEENEEKTINLPISLILTIIGLILVFFGAEYFIDGSINLARKYNIDEAIIGLFLVGIGTALPETATAISASIRSETSLIIGNVIGSCIYNLLLILGVSGLFFDIEINRIFIIRDFPLMIAAILLYGFQIFIYKRISKIFATFMLITYGIYAYLVI